MAKQEEQEPVEVPLHQLYPPVDLGAKGGSPTENQANMIAARNSPGWFLAIGVAAQSLAQRADQILLDYTREMVTVRYQIDGIWHQLDPRDRASGDAMLFCYKKLANLNPADRRSKQEGTFTAKFQKVDYIYTIISQGTQTGERVLLKIRTKKPTLERLEDLGMREKVRQRVKEVLDGDGGMSVFSAPPQGGFSTLWTCALNATDRFVRDFVSLEDKDKPEDEVINVTPHFFDTSKGESPGSLIPKLLLKEPDAFVVPEILNAESMNLLCEQASKDKRPVITRVQAKEVAEALMRMLMYKASPAEFAKAVKLVVNERMVRRLCPSCKQAYQPAPQLMQRLGIPPGRVQAFYREYQPPPPETLVDEKGNPLPPPPPCGDCHGLGYKGRIGIFEVCFVDDQVRKALVSSPTLDSVRQAVRQSGCRGLQEEGILLVAQGITSLTELQRALKQ
ncbi:MAG: Flp pilus assembly complex ATPase component TadA [Planctomycetales bacterium]|nr:Flp pilus assembly complex ATPase component TadA [Planctomycetales bacterium]